MPTYEVSGITWNYTTSGGDATIGIGEGSATTLGTDISGAIIIPSALDGYQVRIINNFAFYNCVNITSVTIPDSVTHIRQGVFDTCSNITSINIPDSVIRIDSGVFWNCTSLTSVTIGKSLAFIEAIAFINCSSLTSINIPDSIINIANSAFQGTSANLAVTMNTKTIAGTTYTSPTTTDIAFFGNPSVTLVLPPLTMTITSTTVTSGSTTNNTTIALTFTSSASTTDFEVGDITVTNGTLSSPLGGSGSVYTATFTPTGQGECTIGVAANVFTSAGQNNTAATTFNWTFDAAPTMAITSTIDSGETTKNASIELTFTASEAIFDFQAVDISFNRGELTAFDGSGSVYTATFTPAGQGAYTINVPVSAYADASGNNNTTPAVFTFNFDAAPSMIITSTIDSGATTKNASIPLTFTASEEIFDFLVEDISFNRGELTAFDGSGSVYTATFTPAGQGAYTINVPVSAYADASGNNNTTPAVFTFNFDAAPTMAITSTIDSGATTKNASIELTFTASEAIFDFQAVDISFNRGELTAFDGSGSVYTATFTPAGQGAYTINVPVSAYADASGNNNTTPAVFTFNFDAAPTMAITSTIDSGATTKNASIELTFTASEAIFDFQAVDISFNRGELTAFDGSGSVYTATFTPAGQGAYTINVPVSAYADASGNNNTTPAVFTFNFDAAPSMVITSTIDSGATTNNASIPLTFTASEAIFDFLVGDISFNRGELTAFDGSGSVYTATFTPAGQGAYTINVPVSAYADASGNNNTTAAVFTFNFDAAPTMAITSTIDSGSTTNNAPIVLTFTASEAIFDFQAEDISFNRGELTAFDGSGSVYTATFTPTIQGAYTINVPVGAYADASGNNNTTPAVFTFNFDAAPSMVITSTIDSGATTNNASIPLTFTASEAIFDFLVGDISFNRGELTAFDGSGSVYTATFTPAGQGAYTINVPVSAYADASGNNNTTAAVFTFNFDAAPTMAITSTIDSGSTTNNAPIVLTFTASEAIFDFQAEDISFNRGELTAFDGSGSVYTATFTPTIQGAYTINVPVGAYADASGNNNTTAAEFTFNFDAAPSMVITSTIESGATTNNASIPLTFTASEAIFDFLADDISFNRGELTAFDGSGSVYTATFTPAGQGSYTINVPVSAYIDASGNNNTTAAVFTFNFDAAPTMAITSTIDSGSTTNNAPIVLTFTASEAIFDFQAEDISFNRGELTAFDGSGSVYTATFTPTIQGAYTINVPVGAYADASGNDNTTASVFTFNFDAAPTMAITSTIDSGATTKNASIELTFTASEAIFDFQVEDISFNRGELTAFDGSGSVYTATFTPAGQGAYTINVPVSAYIDASGNNNTTAAEFTFNFDAAPTMAITSTIDSGATTNNTSIALTFTASEAIFDFQVEDISFNRGELTAFDGSGSVYTATFTPAGQGAYTINVPVSAYIDASGNDNTTAAVFTFNFDAAPTMVITSTIDSGATTKNASIPLTFTASEAIFDFQAVDISFNRGELTAFDGSGSVYTATFTPAGQGAYTINVPVSAYADASGNNNTTAAEFTFNFDAAPSMIITSTIDSGATTNNTSIALTFTASEAIFDFQVEDISFNRGELTAFDGSGSVYTATFTPEGQGAYTINVPVSAYIDASGNDNTTAAVFTFNFDAAPTMVITSTIDSGATTKNASIELTFTASEAIFDFQAVDISFNRGELTAFDGSGSVYTATFTPAGQGAYTINVPVSAYTDASGNNNTTAAVFTFNFDAAPSMIITSTIDSGATTKNASIPLTFTASEAIFDFQVEDISFNRGELTAFDGSGSVYTATFTPEGQGAYTINVPVGAYIDASGNNNTTAAVFTFNFDSVSPSMTITSTIASGSTTNNTSIELTFTSIEAITGFQAGDISFNRGTLTAFDGSGSVYTATFTPDGQGAYTINVPAGAYTDAATNLNNLATQFTFNFDAAPTMAITSTIDSGSTTKNASIELTFTASEAIFDFQVEDISFNRGELTAFDGSGSVYTATFTPAGQGAYTINVPVSAYIDASGNNNTAAAEFTFNFDAAPTMAITSTIDSGSTTKNASIELTFTASEAIFDFQVEDISFNRGELTAFDGSGSVYTATFTPAGQGAYTINVPVSAYIDASGNDNTTPAVFTFNFDAAPSMVITSTIDSGATTKNASIPLTFTASEAIFDFQAVDISFNRGELTAFDGSGSVYTATFTPAGQGAYTINVPVSAYIDASGNDNTTAAVFTFNFDAAPTMIITSTIDSGATTKNASIELTFTASEAIFDFQAVDISFNRGELTAFDGSGSVYTATFTPAGQGAYTINVPVSAYIDASGNDNTTAAEFTFNFDAAPSMVITSTIDSGATTKNASIPLTFTASEAIFDFQVEDISFNRGELTAFDGSGSVYTATFTPAGQGAYTINVQASAYIDASGNNNTTAAEFTFNFDAVPSMVITSTIDSGATTKNASIELTFTASEAIFDFQVEDISFNRGELTAFDGSGSVYTATFTPAGQGAYTINVPASAYVDASGNDNTTPAVFTFNFDAAPSMIITSTIDSGATTKNASIELTFTASEAIFDFQVEDISFNRGELTAFDGSGSVYTATFTPTIQGAYTINVPASAYIDASGNDNTTAAVFTFNFDAAPRMIITSTIDSGATTKNASIPLTFTASEAIFDFQVEDISFNRGELTAFDGSGSVYTAIFTPAGQGAYTINVPVSAYIDASGNDNTTPAVFTFNFDAAPSMVITSTIDSGATTKNASIPLTFTASEAIFDFQVEDISFNRGELTAFDGSGSVYTATFTPAGQGSYTINVPVSAYADASGNNNTTAAEFTFNFDAAPSMVITSTIDSGATTKNASIELTFTASEAIFDFQAEDISFNRGELTAFDGSGSIYTATFTPEGQGAYTINVPASAYIDASGNDNTTAAVFTFNFDAAPSMVITSTIDSGSTTKNASIELTFTASEAIFDFQAEDISFNRGELTAFDGSGSVYTATFTPTIQGAYTINVPASAYIDASGNDNTTAAVFTFNFDAAPTMAITSTIASGSTTNNASIPLTFTASEAIFDFQVEDISFNRGELTAFDGSGSVYTATFTPAGQGAYTINVPVSAYIDASGNDNTTASTFNWTYDSVQPTMSITTTTLGVTSGSTTNNATIALTFTSSKPTNNFIKDDITLNNGTLLTSFDGSGTVYTATFTPNGQGSCTINVPAGAYTDAVGNSNIAATQFIWTFDTVSPSMTITSTTVTSGSTTNNASIALTFTSNEATKNFEAVGISVTNGTLSNFAGIGTDGKVYTATFTPQNQGLCTIGVAAGAYTDEATNLNNLATQFTWTFDSVPPTMTITSTTIASGSTTNNATIELTFTSTKATNNFEAVGISVTNGTLSDFAGSGAVYIATFIPTTQGACTIDVAGGAYTDAVGNSNTAAPTFTFTFDSVSPIMTITSTTVTSGTTTNNATIALTFTSTETTTDFQGEDITVTNGTLSNFAGIGTDGKVYTATFTPDGQGACTINVAAGTYIDALGNSNAAATTFNWTFDSDSPNMTITSTTVTSGTTTNNATIALTFTSSKATNNFVVGDITVNKGTISNFVVSSATVYTATLTQGGQGAYTIDVAANKFTDAFGNNNTAAPTFTFTFDSVSPIMTITSTTVTSGSASKNETIELTFASSKTTNNFVVEDITVNKGTLSNFAGIGTDGKVYTATLTQAGQGAHTINVAANKFTDALGNNNTASNTFNWSFDTVSPIMTITSTTVTSGSTTNRAIALTFTSNEATDDFDAGDISVTNGTLSNFAGIGTDGKVYTATFTPENQGVCTIDVLAGAYTDAATNLNNLATQFTFTFDSGQPTMTITSTTVTSGTTTNNATIALTFTSSKATNNFVVGDITVNKGTISNFVVSSATVYTATLTQGGQGAYTIDVAANKFTDAAGNSNIAAPQFIWTFDSLPPIMTITSTTVTSGSVTKNETIELTFTSSKATDNFEVGDITVNNGTLSNFAGDGTDYTATLTQAGQGTYTINVAAGAYTDALGNNNTAATTFNWSFDTVSPIMTITSTTVTSGSTTNNAIIVLIFTSNEATDDFGAGDIGVTNGTLSNFAGIGTDGYVYTATFAPLNQGLCTIDVSAGAYTDEATNLNNLATQFTFTFDSVQPTMTITSSTVTSGTTTNNATIALTFTSSRATSNFVIGDISVANGELSDFAGIGTDGMVYTATFTPAGPGLCVIGVAAGAYTDAVGNNNNIAAPQFTWTFDRLQPTMTITSTTVTNGSTTNNSPIALTFTSSEATSNFVVGDIRVTNGTLLSSFDGSGAVYTATFTPTGQGACAINVAEGAYTDAVGNSNAAATFNWIFDAVSPSMTITSTTVTSGSTINRAIALTFTSNEATTDFEAGDISVTNGTLSNFAGIGTDGKVYTATFTPLNQGVCTIGVAAGVYTDVAMNLNNLVPQFTFTFDSVSPIMTITSTTFGVTSGSTTNNATIALTFTSNETTNNFVVGDITVTNGALSNFAGIGTDGKVYTATFTPTSSGLCTIGVAAGAYTDAATNLNNLATQFTWTFDGVQPTMTITSTTSGVAGGSIINNAIALRFTSSKATNNFGGVDISVTNGQLTNFASISPTVYTATFTPESQGACTIDVAAGNYADSLGNSNNAANTFSVYYILKFADFNDANKLEQTYITGFLDVSGNINHRSGELSVIDGMLLVNSGNMSINSGNLYVSDNVSINSGLMVTGPTSLIKMVTSANIDVSGASRLDGALTVAGLTTFNNNVGIANNKKFTVGSGTTLFGGDVSMNSTLRVAGDVSMNSTLAVTGLTTLANTSIVGTLVVNGKSTFTTDMSFSAANFDICGNLRAQYLANSIPLSAIIGSDSVRAADVFMNAGLSVAGATTASTLTAKGDTAIGGVLAVTGASTLSSLTVSGDVNIGDTLRVTGKTIFASDVSFNGSRVDICGNLYANYPNNSIPTSAIRNVSPVYSTDLSMNAKLSIAGATTMASTLVVAGKTNFLNDVSFGMSGSRIDIYGNLYANYAANSIPNTAIIREFNADVSMNARLSVKNRIKVDIAKLEYISSALNVNTVLIPTSLNTANLTISNTLNVSGATTLAALTAGKSNIGTLYVTGATTTAILSAGNTNIGGTLYLTAATTFPADVSLNSTLAVTSDVSMNSTLYVGNDASLNSTLFVNRAGSLNSTLFVTGATTLAGVYASTLSVNGATTMMDTAYVAGNSTIGGVLAFTLPYTFAADASLNSKLTVARDVSLNSTLNVNGATTLSRLTIPTNMTLNSTLSITGATTITTDVSANAQLLVVGAATLKSNMYVTTSTNLASTLHVTGETTASTITASGITTIGGTLTVNGKTSISGNVTFNSTTVDVSGNLRASSLGFPSGSTVVRYSQFGDWVKIGNDIDGEAALDESGWSTALSADGSIIAVGAYKNDGTVASATDNRGHVKVYQRDATNFTIAPIGWRQLGGDIDGEATTDQSGYSLSLSADGLTVAIGANQNDGTITNISDNRGHVRVYKYNAPNWTKLGNDIDGEMQFDRSGFSVSLSADGTIVAIGATQNDGTTTNSGDNRGHVRIYQYEASNWTQVGDDIDGEAAADQSGISVSLVRDPSSNIFVAIGANNNDGTTTSTGDNRGHVRVYKYDATKNDADTFGPSKWNRLGADIDGEVAGDGSGVSVSLAANWPNVFVAIGSSNNDGTTTNSGDNRGHVRVYQYVEGKVTETNQTLTTFGPAGWKRLGQDIDGEFALDESGRSVALSSNGSILAIGGYKNDGTTTNASDNRGHVRVYQYQSGTNAWSQFGTDIDGEATGNQSGYSVSLSSDGLTLAIGANLNDGTTSLSTDNRGHVRVFNFSLPSGLYTNAPLIVPNAITTGDVTLYDAINVTRATSLTGALVVAGATTVSTINTSSNATVGGALTVTGATTSTGTLNVSGATRSTTMTLSSNAAIGGTLIVSGAVTMQTLNITGPIKKC